MGIEPCTVGSPGQADLIACEPALRACMGGEPVVLPSPASCLAAPAGHRPSRRLPPCLPHLPALLRNAWTSPTGYQCHYQSCWRHHPPAAAEPQGGGVDRETQGGTGGPSPQQRTGQQRAVGGGQQKAPRADVPKPELSYLAHRYPGPLSRPPRASVYPLSDGTVVGLRARTGVPGQRIW